MAATSVGSRVATVVAVSDDVGAIGPVGDGGEDAPSDGLERGFAVAASVGVGVGASLSVDRAPASQPAASTAAKIRR